MSDKPVFPDHFVALRKYPGYYWHTVERRLYSLKVTGVLKPLTEITVTRQALYAIAKQTKFMPSYEIGERYYRISHNGKNVSILVNKMYTYLEPRKVVPVAPFQGELF